MTNATQFPLNSREWAKWLESRMATVERSINPTATRIAREIAADIFWGNGGGGNQGETGVQFTLASPVPVWTINHNLGRKPIVSVFNTGSVQIFVQVHHLDENQTMVYYDVPTAGFARLI